MLGPARKTTRFARNVWLLRRELFALVFRRQAKREKPIHVRCLRCQRELTKPCKPLSPCHVFKWPAEAGETVIDGERVTAGRLVYVRRQKVRGGQFRADNDVRLKPF